LDDVGLQLNWTQDTPRLCLHGLRLVGELIVITDRQIIRVIEAISSADTWNRRVSLVRQIPKAFGTARHQEIYAGLAEAVYVDHLTPDFAYIHWRAEYELSNIENSYSRAYELTNGYTQIDLPNLEYSIMNAPDTLRIFRLFLGFTTQEFAASTAIVAGRFGAKPLSNRVVKSIESGRIPKGQAAKISATVIDQAMRGELFAAGVGEVRSKLDKPDTVDGWNTVRKYASENVPFPVFLHQRHYGGAFRQLLDSTSEKRGNLLEDAVEELFTLHKIGFIRTGARTRDIIAGKFGLTVTPAPDFVIYDQASSLKAILECKQANDGGTARDKAARYATLRTEAVRLGGVPVFAVLAGLGWRRTGDTLGPVIRDTDGRVFTVKNLESMMSVDPFPALSSEHSK
jgi:hypothetical protein